MGVGTGVGSAVGCAWLGIDDADAALDALEANDALARGVGDVLVMLHAVVATTARAAIARQGRRSVNGTTNLR